MHKIIEIFADRAALHTEILALRQQVAVLKRKRPVIRRVSLTPQNDGISKS